MTINQLGFRNEMFFSISVSYYTVQLLIAVLSCYSFFCYVK